MQPNPLARVALTQLMTRIVQMMMRQQQYQHVKQQQLANLSGWIGVGGGNNYNNNTDNNKQQATVVKGTNNTNTDNCSSSRDICHDSINTFVVDIDNVGDIDGGGGGGIPIGNVIGATNNDDDGILISIMPTIVTDICAINTTIVLCEAVIALMENIKQIEVTALIYIESKFIDKFLSEHLLRPEHVITLVRFIGSCCQCIKSILNRPSLSPVSLNHEERNCITVSLHCIDILLHQKFIWYALNQQQQQQQQQQQTFVKPMPTTSEGGSGGGGGDGDTTIDSCLPLTKCEVNKIICSLLDVVVLSGSLLLENTMFYRKYKNALRSSPKQPQQTQQQHNYQQQVDHEEQLKQEKQEKSFENEACLTAEYNPKVIFLGKLIETKIGNNDKGICFGEYNNSSSNGYTTSASASVSASFATSNNNVLDLKGINNQFDFISLVSISFIPYPHTTEQRCLKLFIFLNFFD